MTDLEDRLVDYFQDLTRVVDERMPTVDVAGAMRCGRRRRCIRQLRRAAEWTCTAVVVAAVVGGGYAIWSSTTPGTDTHQAATAPTASVSPAETHTSAPPRTSADVAQTLTRLLRPYGTVGKAHLSSGSHSSSQIPTVKGSSTNTGVSSPVASWVRLNTDAGQAAVAAAVATGTSTTDVACPAGESITCDRQRLPDGTVVTSVQEPPGPEGQAALWYVAVARPDQTLVKIVEWNGQNPKGMATRGMVTPPLTMTQLRTIATSDKW